MDVNQCIPSSTIAKPFLWKRDQIASALVRAQAMADTGVSQEQRAAQLEVPRTTLQNWERNRQRLNQQARLDATEVQFFRITPRARSPA
jgi:DNA-binding XRE family transcriptional regulator